MEGRMFKVSVLMDNDKILKEGKYPIKDIYYTIEKTYANNGFIRDYDQEDGAMMFYGVKGWADGDGMMKASYFLRKQDWFMGYVKKWIGHENEQCAYDDDFIEVDIISMIKQHGNTVGVM
jgi:hypothetical protein